MSGAGDYALHITKRLLGFYQDYFKVQYSLPKLGKALPLAFLVLPGSAQCAAPLAGCVEPQRRQKETLCSPSLISCQLSLNNSHAVYFHPPPPIQIRNGKAASTSLVVHFGEVSQLFVLCTITVGLISFHSHETHGPFPSECRGSSFSAASCQLRF